MLRFNVMNGEGLNCVRIPTTLDTFAEILTSKTGYSFIYNFLVFHNFHKRTGMMPPVWASHTDIFQGGDFIIFDANALNFSL